MADCLVPSSPLRGSRSTTYNDNWDEYTHEYAESVVLPYVRTSFLWVQVDWSKKGREVEVKWDRRCREYPANASSWDIVFEPKGLKIVHGSASLYYLPPAIFRCVKPTYISASIHLDVGGFRFLHPGILNLTITCGLSKMSGYAVEDFANALKQVRNLTMIAEENDQFFMVSFSKEIMKARNVFASSNVVIKSLPTHHVSLDFLCFIAEKAKAYGVTVRVHFDGMLPKPLVKKFEKQHPLFNVWESDDKTCFVEN